uniref:Uncharacterized protein n=1 Tax=Glossina pallidipes TaxID=7398 RepID=A0A1B0A374_GLOPL
MDGRLNPTQLLIATLLISCKEVFWSLTNYDNSLILNNYAVAFRIHASNTALRLISFRLKNIAAFNLHSGNRLPLSYNKANSRNLTSLRNTKKALIKWRQYEQFKVIKEILD